MESSTEKQGSEPDRDELQQREESLEQPDPSRRPAERAVEATAIGAGALVLLGGALVVVVILLAVILV